MKSSLLWLSLASRVVSQTLLEAISTYPELSNFTTLMTDNPGLANALLTSNASSLTGESTILVPDNSAFTKFSSLYKNTTMGNLTVEQLEPFLEYHLLVGRVGYDNLTEPQGLTVPTYLTGPTYNNRSAGAALGSTGADGDIHNGQVVFLQAKTDNGTTKRGARRLSLRQLQNPSVNAVGGLGHAINLTAVDGKWDGGYFQIVDKFLDLPLNCTDSIKRWNMTSFRSSLDRTGLGTPLDITRNVTCLTPNNNAFLNAGSPDVTANITDLQEVIKFHTLVEPIYSSFLEDGSTFTTFSNQTVRVTIDTEGAIFFNDAKVLNKDVMTNNGLMYVLDRVMSPLDSESAASTSTAINQGASATRTNVPFATATGPATVTVTASPSASASASASGNLAVQGVSLPMESFLGWVVADLAVLGALFV